MTEPTSHRAWDTLVRGALVFDGTGAPPRTVDVAVSDGKIAAIGVDLPTDAAREVVEADGLWLMPGLLDIHTHLDLEVEIDPGLSESVRHGTTTVVVGNCSIGTAFGAQRSGAEDPIVDCFARVETIPKSVLRRYVERMDWKGTAAYLDHLAQLPLGPNIAPLIPHSMLRVQAMGTEGAVGRRPTDDERRRMTRLLDDAIDQGYIGMSTDALSFHYMSNRPNQQKRLPSRLAERPELKELLDRLRAHDRVWQTTPDDDNPLRTLARFFWTSGRLFRKPLRLSALVAIDFVPVPIAWRILLAVGRLLNSKLIGGLFHFQALSTSFRVWSNGADSSQFEELDSTRELIATEVDDPEAADRLMRDPAFRARLRADLESVRPKRGLRRILAGPPKTSFELNPELMFVDGGPVKCWDGEAMDAIIERLRTYQDTGGASGARDSEEAEAFSRFPAGSADIVPFFEHCLAEYGHGFRWWMDLANTRPEVLEKILFDPNTLPGFNDSGAHIANVAFYDGNLMVLQIAQRRGLARVADAVRRLTSAPAGFFGLDVGKVEVGAQADLVLIDPEALRHYDTDARRERIWRDAFEHEFLVNRSDGVVREVYIRGTRVWEDGCRTTEALGTRKLGRPLRYTERA